MHFYKAVRDRNAAAVQKRKSRYLNLDALSETVDAQWKRLSETERKVYEDQATANLFGLLQLVQLLDQSPVSASRSDLAFSLKF